MVSIQQPRTFDQWLYRPSEEESICRNPFRDAVKRHYDDPHGLHTNALNPFHEDVESGYTKIAKLLHKDIILLEGDVIYVRQGHELLPLNEAIPLLAYYMHVDTKEAGKAAAVIETQFQGFIPIVSNKVWRNGITIVKSDGTEWHVNLSTMEASEEKPFGFPEFGKHPVCDSSYEPLFKYFHLINKAVGDPWFFEKTLMYPFNQRIREKSHVLVGGGGNGKSLFMKMVERLYGNKALGDAPQPNFSGHSAGVISYNFIGKRLVTFNDVGEPDLKFMEWLKRMITGNLEVKSPSGSWMSVPCNTNFLLETNHRPQFHNIAAHRRRYIVREFRDDFLLAEHMTNEELDIIGERGKITAGDLVNYLLLVGSQIDNWIDFDSPEDIGDGEVAL